MPFRNSRRVAVAMLSLTFALSPVAAQKKPDQDPSEKPRNVKPELKKAYKDWLEKDVAYIITDEERKAFKKLGLKIKDTYLTMGRYDLIMLLEAPNDDVVATALLSLAAQGNVTTETLKAWSEDEYRKITGSI